MARVEHEHGKKRISQIYQRGRPSKSELRSQRNKERSTGRTDNQNSSTDEPVRQLGMSQLVQIEPNGRVIFEQ